MIYDKYIFALYQVPRDSPQRGQFHKFNVLYVEAKRLWKRLGELGLEGDLSHLVEIDLRPEFLDWILVLEDFGVLMGHPSLVVPLHGLKSWFDEMNLQDSFANIRMIQAEGVRDQIHDVKSNDDGGGASLRADFVRSDARIQIWISRVHELKMMIQQHDCWNQILVMRQLDDDSNSQDISCR